MLNGPDSNHGGCRCGAKHDAKYVVHVILLQTYRIDKATANTDNSAELQEIECGGSDTREGVVHTARTHCESAHALQQNGQTDS